MSSYSEVMNKLSHKNELTNSFIIGLERTRVYCVRTGKHDGNHRVEANRYYHSSCVWNDISGVYIAIEEEANAWFPIEWFRDKILKA